MKKPKKRTALEMVRDYAVYIGKPFTYKDVMQDLGIARRTAMRAISRLYEAGHLRCLNYRTGSYKWNPKGKPIERSKYLAEKSESPTGWKEIPAAKQIAWHQRLQMVV